MTTAVATTVQSSPLIAMGQRFNIEPPKLMEVLRGTVIKPDRNGKHATNEEVAAFCIVAQQYGLNPFTREIHAFTSGEKGVVPIVGIDGWTHIVNSSDGFNGCDFDEVEDKDGKPVSVTCRMYVKGREHPVSATERFKECYRNTIPWNSMPFRMLRHKAYMQAARYAFGLSGIFDEDEARDIINGKGNRAEIAMPQARQAIGVTVSPPVTQQPEEQAASTTQEPPPAPPEQATAPVPPAEPEPPAENAANVTVGIIDSVTVKDGTKKDGSKWTKYGVRIKNTTYGTFDHDIGRDAQELEGCSVRLTWEQDGKYFTILSLEGLGPAKDTPGNTDAVPREQAEQQDQLL